MTRKKPERKSGITTESALTAPVKAVGDALGAFFGFLGETARIFTATLILILRGKINIRDTVNLMASIGVSSLPIVAVTVMFSGGVISLYLAQIVVKWGFGSYTGAVVGISVVREIAPILTAVVVAARAGSAIAAEISSMKVTEQIDALKALAVNPLEYLAVPRMVAAVLTLPMLAMMADVAGVFGGYYVAIANKVASGGFIATFEAMVTPRDITMGLIKTLFFAVVIVTVAVQQGLRVEGGAAGVGKATTNTVVLSIVIIYILNFILAYVMFNGGTAVG
ncbi:MAG: ABC transporter permease [Abditibacteriota bacterium]|nr:ABC transporter permease [Abditibacteriota bacterium]